VVGVQREVLTVPLPDCQASAGGAPAEQMLRVHHDPAIAGANHGASLGGFGVA